MTSSQISRQTGFVKEDQRKKTLCIYFKEGYCQRGASCWFAHGEHELQGADKKIQTGLQQKQATPQVKKKLPFKAKPCKYYLEGRCQKGAECTFAHSDQVRQAPVQEQESFYEPSPEVVTTWEIESPEEPGWERPKSSKKKGLKNKAKQQVQGLERDVTLLESKPVNSTQRELQADMEEIERLLSVADLDEPPECFLCPITMEVFRDPCTAADGFSYERVAIEDWLKKKDTSPLTNVPLEDKELIPNFVLRKAIIAQYQYMIS